MNKSFFLISLFVILFYFSFSCFGLSVSPDRKEVDYTPGEEINFVFMVGDFEHTGIEVALEGAGANETQILTKIEECNSPCQVKFKYKIPEVSEPGEQALKVKFKELPPPSSYGRPAISAVAQIVGLVYFIVPYPNKYLTLKIGTSDGGHHFQIGNKVYFTALVKSYGKEAINNIQGTVFVHSQDESYRKELYLTPINNLEFGQEEKMYAEWDSTEVKQKGVYYYQAIVNYDGKEVTHSWSLELGDQEVEVEGFSPSELKEKKINKMQVSLKNYWNNPLKVYVSAVLLSNGTAVCDISESSTVKIEPSETKNVGLYLDLEDVPSGAYELEMASHFGDKGQTITKRFNVNVAKDSPKTLPEPSKSKGSNFFAYVLLAVAVLLLTALIYFWRGKNRDSKEEI